LARVRDPATGEVIDEALALWFPGPNSETGEDIAELQLHGGRAVIAAALGALGHIEGLRLAEAGEFTRRAFENGRLDLTAVEGLADLIGAETEAQRRQAYRQLKGLLGKRAETWRARMIEALALVEARIDFSDEADVPEDLLGPALKIVQGLRDEIADALAGAARGERLRDGLVVAIAGPPNAGKSTLLNRIARREAAIVSPIPGTTRDVIEVHLDLDGYPVTLLDTAGIRDSEDPVEQEGVRRARQRAGEADLVLWVYDASDDGVRGDVPPFANVPIWAVRNKLDLAPVQRSESIRKNEYIASDIVFSLSAATGLGVAELLAELGNYAKSYFGAESSLLTRERHRKALSVTQSALDRVLAEGASGREDIVAEELRLATQSLGRLTGQVDVEDILDVIFRDFCIGK
jgi:tRNA modification GTPase